MQMLCFADHIVHQWISSAVFKSGAAIAVYRPSYALSSCVQEGKKNACQTFPLSHAHPLFPLLVDNGKHAARRCWFTTSAFYSSTIKARLLYVTMFLFHSWRLHVHHLLSQPHVEMFLLFILLYFISDSWTRNHARARERWSSSELALLFMLCWRYSACSYKV